MKKTLLSIAFSIATMVAFAVPHMGPRPVHFRPAARHFVPAHVHHPHHVHHPSFVWPVVGGVVAGAVLHSIASRPVVVQQPVVVSQPVVVQQQPIAVVQRKWVPGHYRTVILNGVQVSEWVPGHYE